MGTELDEQAVVAAAQQIINESATRGFAWAPWVDVRRYGIMNGLIKPILTNMGLNSQMPPVVIDAPKAGREDFQQTLRRDAK